jgi:hypothetical protein
MDAEGIEVERVALRRLLHEAIKPASTLVG